MDCVRGDFFPAIPANAIASESFSTNYIPANARFIYLYINVFPSAIFPHLFVISCNLILSVFFWMSFKTYLEKDHFFQVFKCHFLFVKAYNCQYAIVASIFDSIFCQFRIRQLSKQEEESIYSHIFLLLLNPVQIAPAHKTIIY